MKYHVKGSILCRITQGAWYEAAHTRERFNIDSTVEAKNEFEAANVAIALRLQDEEGTISVIEETVTVRCTDVAPKEPTVAEQMAVMGVPTLFDAIETA